MSPGTCFCISVSLLRRPAYGSLVGGLGKKKLVPPVEAIKSALTRIFCSAAVERANCDDSEGRTSLHRHKTFFIDSSDTQLFKISLRVFKLNWRNILALPFRTTVTKATSRYSAVLQWCCSTGGLQEQSPIKKCLQYRDFTRSSRRGTGSYEPRLVK